MVRPDPERMRRPLVERFFHRKDRFAGCQTSAVGDAEYMLSLIHI